MADEMGTVVVPPHICDMDHRWDAERKVWLCLPNPPWFGRAYSLAMQSGTRSRRPGWSAWGNEVESDVLIGTPLTGRTEAES